MMNICVRETPIFGGDFVWCILYSSENIDKNSAELHRKKRENRSRIITRPPGDELVNPKFTEFRFDKLDTHPLFCRFGAHHLSHHLQPHFGD